jgi:hypothetical protein
MSEEQATLKLFCYIGLTISPAIEARDIEHVMWFKMNLQPQAYILQPYTLYSPLDAYPLHKHLTSQVDRSPSVGQF